jgi:hypothetical protein
MTEPGVSGVALTVPPAPAFDVVRGDEVWEKIQGGWNPCSERMTGDGVLSWQAEVRQEIRQDHIELAWD